MLTTWETLLAAARVAAGQPAVDRAGAVRALVSGLGAGELLALAQADPGLLAVTDYPADRLPARAQGGNPSALDIVAAILQHRLLATLGHVADGAPPAPPPPARAALLDQLWWWAGDQLQEASRRQELAPEPEGADYWAGAVHALHQVLAHLDEQRAAGPRATLASTPAG